jgi:hypothetical protein
MKIRSLLLGLAAVAALAFTIPASGQVTLPQVQQINPTDLFEDIVRGAPSAQSQYASALLMSGYNASQPVNLNAVIGGDAGTNLFQRATTGASVTTTITYGGPDRFAYWSGTATAMTVSRDTTAADLPAAAYQAAFKMARTSGQTGVIPLCMVQEVETVNAIMFQGQTAELDFWATAGANYSAASSALTAYIITGTGTDEGVSKMAFAFNAGGGGSSTWAGQASTVADVATISTAPTRFAAVGSIPVGTTEIGVMFCYTPVGTAGTNDYVAISGIQLTRNASLASIAASTTASDCSTINCTAFARRHQGLEALLQYRYFYKLTETAAIDPVGPCAAIDTTHTNCWIAFSTPMRIAPTGTYVAGFASPTSTTQATLGACSALATAVTVTSAVAAPTGALVTCTATTIPAAGIASFLYSNNGSGTMSFTSEL